jgi:hypothetical protein
MMFALLFCPERSKGRPNSGSVHHRSEAGVDTDLAVMAPGVTTTGLYGDVDISGSRDFQDAYIVDPVSADADGRSGLIRRPR